jgi:hypothetical protein
VSGDARRAVALISHTSTDLDIVPSTRFRHWFAARKERRIDSLQGLTEPSSAPSAQGAIQDEAGVYRQKLGEAYY